MSPAEFIAWAQQQDAAGKTDAMGWSWTSWKVARYNHDGTAMRDEHGHQVFETQGEFIKRTTRETSIHHLAPASPAQPQLELFA